MLDSSGYLASFGWKGQGNGLRHGSTPRPLAIPQKRTLAGLGKDRDEAFPFWDHLFAAAAKSIQIKVSGDEGAIEDNQTPLSNFSRTTTGILSNRRPVSGTPVTEIATPSESSSQCPTPRLSLMASAKRESARKRLYANFFRGPVLGPDVDDDSLGTTPVAAETVGDAQNTDIRSEQKRDELDERDKQKKKGEKKKRKRDQIELALDEENKKRKKGDFRRHDHDAIIEEEKITVIMQDFHHDEGQQIPKLERKGKDQGMKRERVETAEEKRNRKMAKAERKKVKEDRKKRKEDRRKRKEDRRKRKEDKREAKKTSDRKM